MEPGASGPHRVTIDLDGAWCYRAIHGDVVDVDDASDDDAVLNDGLPRFLDLCARLDITATLFVVARDLQRPRFAAHIKAAADAGHSVMSHSFSHAYDLASWPRPQLLDDLVRSKAAIADVTGTSPPGFRAPGYTTSPAMWSALIEAGYHWSSSVLPSPSYLLARAAVRARAQWRGAVSASQSGSRRAFSPWFQAPPAPLTEFAITTAATLPWTGTSLALLPDKAAFALTRLAVRGARGRRVVFELHAADFADGRHLPNAQPDARVPLADKLRRIERTLVHITSQQG